MPENISADAEEFTGLDLVFLAKQISTPENCFINGVK